MSKDILFFFTNYTKLTFVGNPDSYDVYEERTELFEYYDVRTTQ